MKTRETVSRSPCKKRKLFGNLVGKYDLEIDPCYKLFLENLSIDGSTYVFDVPNGDHGMPVCVRYGDYGNVMDNNVTDFPKCSVGTSVGAPKGKQKGEASGKAASGNVSHSPGTSCIRNIKTSAIDDSYKQFLSLVKFKDGSMVVEPEPGVTVVYEQEKGMPARYNGLRAGSPTNGPIPLISPTENVEEIVMCASEDGLAQADKIVSEDEMIGPSSGDLDGQDIICTNECGDVLHTEPSDLNKCRDNQGAQLALFSSGSSTFDEKLNAVLSQPYDQDEYEDLWRKATDRKPVSGQRHLRSATKRYATKTIGQSYLDHYPELAVQIDSADSVQRLTLLRKFFFWLENLCHEGAYMPWIPRPLACEPISPDEYEETPRIEQ